MPTLVEQLDELHIAGASLTADGRIAVANRTLSKTLGRSLSSLVGQRIADVLASVAAEAVGEGPARAYRIDADASFKWIKLELKRMSEGSVALLTDVTHEKQLLDTIRAYHETRDHLLHDGKVGTWRYDPDEEVYYFSSELSLGHENATAPVPISVLQLIQHPDDREKDTQIRKRITREGGFANAEMRYREASGSWTHLNVHYRSGRQLASGRYEMFGISQNITEIAKARDSANQISQRLTLALRAANSGVFEYDYHERKFWLSEELKELIGSAAVESIEKDPLALFLREDRTLARSVFTNATATDQVSSADFLIHLTGVDRWMRFYFGVTERDAQRAPVLGVGLLLDIDTQKRQEIALADAQRDAEFANRTKTQFLANMSHELRTPLNAILGFSEIITRQMFGKIEEKYVGYARDIHRSGSHLLELVNDVLDLAKLEAGKLKLREAPVSISELADDCLVLVRGQAEAGDVRLQKTIEAPPLLADERAVKQLLLNLLSNAVKFTPHGGCVTLTAALDETGCICLSVSDTGIGMTASEIEIALSPFGQVDSTLARKNEGTGLGLSICKSLMELHGGALGVTSVPERGTTFTAKFPAHRTIGRATSSAA